MRAANDRASMIELVKQSVIAWMNDYAPSMGAALSYYTLFSLAPLRLLVIAVAGLVFDADVARGEMLAQLGGLIGTEGVCCKPIRSDYSREQIAVWKQRFLEFAKKVQK
jgi:membrane protein